MTEFLLEATGLKTMLLVVAGLVVGHVAGRLITWLGQA